MPKKVPFNFSFEFIEPSEDVLEHARKLVDSPDENCRSVAKAVLDVVAAGRAIKDALRQKRSVNLDSYFDFWFADATTCAQRLRKSGDQVSRNLAECLIKLEEATIKSKESFLKEMKRLGVKPKDD